MLKIECMKEWEKTESSCGVTVRQIVLHLLPLISDGVKSEKSWERPTDRLDSWNGKTENNYASPHDSASRDNWVTAALTLTLQAIQDASWRDRPSAVCWMFRDKKKNLHKQEHNRNMTGQKLKWTLNLSLFILIRYSLKQTLAKHWCKLQLNSSTTPIICWLAAMAMGRDHITLQTSF